MFKVTVTEVGLQDAEKEIVRFEQIVDELNLRAVIAAVNAKPRKPRTPAKPKLQAA